MSMYSFLSNLRQKVGFPQSNSLNDGSSSPPDNLASTSQNDDNEDDGYLLIGGTRHPFSTQQITEKTLNYGLISSEIPSPQMDVSGQITSISGPTMFSRVSILPLKSEDFTPTQTQRSPLSDIPFRLHPSLDAQLQANALFHNLNLEHCSFDWSRYSHDFMKENLSLRDMNSDEMANIDEFLLPPAEHWPAIKSGTSGSSEVSLMQF